MKRSVKFGLIGAILVGALAVIALIVSFFKGMPIGTGYTAKYLCSSTFISGRDPGTVFREDVLPVNPMARLVSYEIDPVARSVHASSLGLVSSTAIYREGCGCSLIGDTTAGGMNPKPPLPPDFKRLPPTHPSDRPWPQGNGDPADPAGVDVDADLLARVVDQAFAEPAPEPKRNTRAVLVVYRGQLIAERYADGFHKEMPMLGWSMSKSVTSALVGVLVGEGKLDIMAPAPVPEWNDPTDPRRTITIDQLLRMSSGLAFDEVYAPFYDVTYMLYSTDDFGAFAAEKRLAAPPGTEWKYSSGTANIVARVVREAVAPDAAYYYPALYEKFFDRIGMSSAILEPDASGTFVGSSYIFATARDWARFGLLYLQDGVWNGERILPEGWVAYTTTPTPPAPKGEYGAMFWLNAGAPGDPNDRRWPDAPGDAYAAEGFQEQKVIIIPSRDTVLVRFGATTDRSTWNTSRFIHDVLAVLP